ncbi:MAG TPA: GNAT family N-acetyltransferase [Steroidobacteraceae bacterium]|nr:GNAT family N-acetyltransferase [Steroidobacteraceae bacterium]
MSTMPDHLQFAQRVTAYMDCAPVTQGAVPNLVTRIDSVGNGPWRMPVTVNDAGSNGSWVCSPYVTYVRYAAEEVARFGHPALGPPLALMCRVTGLALRCGGIDRAVGLNNWTLSTNLFPALEEAALRACMEECMDRWPQHAIWVRSLNGRHTPDWMAALEDQGCLMIPSRQVYLYDTIDPRGAGHTDLGRDLRLLERTTLAPSPATAWSAHDFQQAERLYGLLYLEKYSRLNPAYSARWLQCWSRAGLLDLVGYRDADGQLVAIVGMFGVDDLITAPIVGYDTSLPQRLGLYRLLMATVLREAARTGRRINLSAGAAGFKRLRGGIGTMEYSAVQVRHLRRRRRLPAQALALLARHVGQPLLQRYEL